MEEKTVLYEKEANIARITFNRPAVLNAVNDQLMAEFHEALAQARQDEGVRVVILKGRGRAFSAGADLKEEHATFEEYKKHLKRAQSIARAARDLGKPMVAAVQGYALGGGCEFAMCCDIRIASEDAKFGFPEVSVGATIYCAGTYLLPRIVGVGKAKELILCADMIDAREAERIGLVNKVVPLEDLDKAAKEMAQKIARNYALAVQLARDSVDSGLDSSFDAVLAAEINSSCTAFSSGERAAGRAAQRERVGKKEGHTV